MEITKAPYEGLMEIVVRIADVGALAKRLQALPSAIRCRARTARIAMRQLLTISRRSVPVAITAIGCSACAQPLMKMPDELVGRADTYEVSGRMGLVFLNFQISFGPYRTVSIHRGIYEADHSSVATGVFSSAQHDSSNQEYAFVLQGPSPGTWHGHCVASSDRQSETRVVGAHFGTDGTGLDREHTVLSSGSSYVCQLDGPAAEHWKLETDKFLWNGTVEDATGLLVDIKRTDEGWSWKHQAQTGNTLIAPNGDIWALVQRTYSGAVFLSRDLDPKQRAAAAAICVALLIPGI